MTGAGPNRAAVGEVAAEHLGPLLYALEVCATAMDNADRSEDASYYRALARRLADAGGREEPAAASSPNAAETPPTV